MPVWVWLLVGLPAALIAFGMAVSWAVGAVGRYGSELTFAEPNPLSSLESELGSELTFAEPNPLSSLESELGSELTFAEPNPWSSF